MILQIWHHFILGGGKKEDLGMIACVLANDVLITNYTFDTLMTHCMKSTISSITSILALEITLQL